MNHNLNDENIVDHLFGDLPSDDNSLTDIDDFDDHDYLPSQQKAIEVVESSSSDEMKKVTSLKKTISRALFEPPSTIDNTIVENTPEFEFTPPNWSKNFTSNWPPLPDFESPVGPSDSVDTFQCHTPYSIFNYLFSDEIIHMLVEQTNLYSFQRNQKNGKPYTQTNIQELKTFFGINLLMGIKRMPSYRDYWSSSPDLHDSYISKLMTVNRFGWLLPTLHINNNVLMPKRGDIGYDKLFKVRPFLTKIKKNFQTYYNPHRIVAVDESID
ncbi:piggyBac transposable element-derived protein 4-like [Sipha flava]|uniref:PiggyBac transposable element-derived protein 4-like n=1 Tax=Sipha flava TaxID=143950 RepID=A0A8B8GEB5_9HEMI|nr:piggyBac transposable element-derived protein 4-like [Sipha flava]